jgi:hypothetical protein
VAQKFCAGSSKRIESKGSKINGVFAKGRYQYVAGQKSFL